MRKIFSILLALGLVLGMVAAAAPAAAQGPGDWTYLTRVIANPCEFELSAYTFTFTPTADLHSGTHSITIRFPEGTGFPEIWRDGHIVVNTEPVFGSEVTRDGNDVTFLLPLDIVGPNLLVTVVFQTVSYMGQTTGIRNPAAGTYFYFVKTSRAPNSEWVRSGWSDLLGRYVAIRIQPAIASYSWRVDFGNTYPGIGLNFVPPFKACGQPSDFDPDWQPGDLTTPYDTWQFEPDKWASNFTLSLRPGFGCAFCRFDTSLVLTSAPAGALVSVFTPDGPETMKMVQGQDRVTLANHGGPVTANILWELGLHFDKVGTYEICFEAWAIDSGACYECNNVQRCFTFEVKQWKDAIPIYLGEKWNLISLPIVPFDTSIDAVLASFDAGYLVRSIWNYDRCDDEWFAYGNGHTSLETIEDGKSYWVRMPTKNEFIAMYTPAVGAVWAEIYWNFANVGPPWTLWIWGTETPMPPAGPSAYLQCPGWNMLGFRSVIDRTVGGVVGDEYLYGHTFGTHYTAVYGWNAGAWQSLATTDDMVVGRGYWAYWQLQRTVNPPL